MISCFVIFLLRTSLYHARRTADFSPRGASAPHLSSQSAGLAFQSLPTLRGALTDIPILHRTVPILDSGFLVRVALWLRSPRVIIPTKRNPRVPGYFAARRCPDELRKLIGTMLKRAIPLLLVSALSTMAA